MNKPMNCAYTNHPCKSPSLCTVAVCRGYESPESGPATVTIPLAQFKKLKYDSAILAALQAGGVGDWEWFDASLEDNLPDEYKNDY